jgi:hypothetical protein
MGFRYSQFDMAYLFTSCLNPTRGLSDSDYVSAAQYLGIEAAAVQAVAEVESPPGAFDEWGRSAILYERHYFNCLTFGRYDLKYPDI